MTGDPALSFRCSQCFTGVNLTEPDEGGIRRWVCENGHECGIYASLDGALDLGIIREDSGAYNDEEVDAEAALADPAVAPSPMLTDLEREALDVSGRLAGLLRRVIGDGTQAENDWAELCAHVHAIQRAVMAQAAARAYPGEYRPLGGV